MKIQSNLYEQLIQLPLVPPEVGGILGGNGDEINRMVVDIGMPSYQNGIYIPNIFFLNECINEWRKNNIEFMGMFHTHAWNWPDLSLNDRKYIIHIMNAMPDVIAKLYFPIVFPLNFVRAFEAKRIEEQIIITEVEIIKV